MTGGTITLPPLRQELCIEPSAPRVGGAPSWTLFDPVCNKFFHLGELEFIVLDHWANHRAAELPETLFHEGIEGEVASELINEVVQFCCANHLVVHQGQQMVHQFARQRSAMRKAWWRWLMDNYLFIRIPLVKPGAFLRRTLPHVEFLFSRNVAILFGLAALLGLVLVSRQWDAFLNSFLYFFSLEGLVAYGLGLAVVKVIHELGHAYMATRFGCRVPAMGIAFLVMMPVLYTDTTSAWRLRSRRKRLLIDCAGIMAELGVAVIATLVWVALPDGALRSSVFILATTSWIHSLVINSSPFMRFDGYYVLSDLMGMPNLQSRAFALGRWWMRERLFDLGGPEPEPLPARTRRWMIVYAYATWLYRLVLFIGIAVLVYHMFFKALGVILFLVEIVAFVARPVFREIREWYSMRDRIWKQTRVRTIALFGGIAIVLLALPIDMRTSAPAVLSTVRSEPLIPGTPAQLQQVLVTNGQHVKAGTPVAVLTSPDIDREIAQAKVRIAQLEAQVNRIAADDEDRANLSVLRSDLAGQRLELASLEQQRNRLVVAAPANGVIVDISTDMTAGRWLGGDEPIARLISPGAYDVQAYVDEGAIWRVGNGASARFIPNDPTQRSVSVKVDEVAAIASEKLNLKALGSSQGGPIAVDDDKAGNLKPRAAIYRIHLAASSDKHGRQADIEQQVPGIVVISASPSSPLFDLLRKVTRIWSSNRPI